MNQITKKEHQSFESIRRKTKEDKDFWSARNSQTVLGYKSWDKFKAVIQKAIKASTSHFYILRLRAKELGL